MCSATTAARRASALLVAACLALAGGCRPRNLDSVGSAENPVLFLLSPDHARGLSPDNIRAIGEALAKDTGLSVDVWVAPSEEAAIHAVGANRVDMAVLPLIDYLFVRREYQAVAGLRLLRDAAHADYAGVFAVKDESPLTRLEDLAGKKVAFVGEHSTTGFVLPCKILQERKVKAEAVFTGTHDASLAALRAGTVDAAVTFEGAFAPGTGLRVLATMPRVPNEPVFFRAGLSADKRRRLSDALLRYATSPEGKTMLSRVAGATGLEATTDAAYVEATYLLERSGQHLNDLVANGWTISRQNQVPLSDYAP